MELLGILAAMLASALGGTAVGATRYLADALDPFTIGAVRFGGGFVLLLLIAFGRGERWPSRRDWGATAALGLLLFGLFPILFNAAMIFTTAARAALALSTVPLLTMVTGAVLRVEALKARKLVGVMIAMGGVVFALGVNASLAPDGAWRGDLLMLAGAVCMALYNVLSRPFIARSGPIPFAATGMGIGAAVLVTASLVSGGFGDLAALDTGQWVANLYLAIVCGALIFFLWAYALGRTSPTLVAVSVALNPITASIFGLALLGEAVGPALIVGLVAILSGIAIASGFLALTPVPRLRLNASRGRGAEPPRL
ncbi:DMT family transporter [Acuticoccus sp. M5D2P5]|uniref:DMT family transporter n=1 Tax=Acuticoccus kalidii TaxID=2910977 RepID=UPI001F3ECE81|nr:DMT family transporter [Acuticoccus kalidii]MCF3934576.1 DMT family transporter [Acuticoccus kalidii]